MHGSESYLTDCTAHARAAATTTTTTTTTASLHGGMHGQQANQFGVAETEHAPATLESNSLLGNAPAPHATGGSGIAVSDLHVCPAFDAVGLFCNMLVTLLLVGASVASYFDVYSWLTSVLLTLFFLWLGLSHAAGVFVFATGSPNNSKITNRGGRGGGGGRSSSSSNRDANWHFSAATVNSLIHWHAAYGLLVGTYVTASSAFEMVCVSASSGQWC